MNKIVLTDDHDLFAQGMKQMLESQQKNEVVYIAKNGQEAIDWLEGNTADLIVLDLDMPVMNGLQCLEALRKVNIDIKVLVVSMKTQEVYAQKIKELGGQGFLPKNASYDKLTKVVDEIIKGGTYFQVLNDSKESKQLLSKSEIEIVQFMANGLSIKEIALKRKCSAFTIRAQQSIIQSKLGVTNPSEIIQAASELGLTLGSI